MSGYPVLLDGGAVTALVVGGGRVASRKVRALLGCGARVRVVAPSVSEELRGIAETEQGLSIETRRFRDDDIRDATLVFAATDDRATNARVARLARVRHRLVSVADRPSEGNFIGMATHRSGDVIIGVSAGGVPRAAARIRDTLAQRFDARYASAIRALQAARRRLLDSGGAPRWQLAMQQLVDERFCSRAESGEIAGEADAWR